MNLIRLLLLEREGEEPIPDLSAYGEEAILYHTVLIIEAGLVHGEAVYDAGEGKNVGAVVGDLTWEGHEFLDVARPEDNWKKVTKAVAKSGGQWTFSIVKDGLKAYAMHELAKHGIAP